MLHAPTLSQAKGIQLFKSSYEEDKHFSHDKEHEYKAWRPENESENCASEINNKIGGLKSD